MKKPLYILVAIIFVQLVLLVSLQFTAWPEMFSFPYLLNQGFNLYGDMVHPYTPLLTLVLAGLYKIFGYEIWAMKGLAWGLAIINSAVIYKILAKITKNKWAPIAGTAIYALFMPFLEGNMVWPDTVVVTPILFGILYIVDKPSLRQIAVSGLFFGLAILIKQTAGLFLIAVVIYLFLTKRDFKKILYFISPSLVFGFFMFLYLAATSSLGWFLNWTLIYPSRFWTQIPGYVDMNIANRDLVIIITLVAPFFVALSKYKKRDENILLLLLLFLASVISVYPRFSFFHFQSTLAITALLTGYVYSKSSKLVGRSLLVSGVVMAYMLFPALKTHYRSEDRFYSQQEFAFAQYISIVTKNSDSIYFLGLYSINYHLTDSLPPIPWVDNFPWYWEMPGFAEYTVDSWEENKPEYIVSDRNLGSPNSYQSLLGEYVNPKLAEWIFKNYNIEQSSRNIDIWQRKN